MIWKIAQKILQLNEDDKGSIIPKREVVKAINVLSSYDVISSYAIAVMQWSVCLKTHHSVAQVSFKICKLCFKFLKELSEF
jgi:hypothetical protein